MGRAIQKTEKYRRIKQLRCFAAVHEMLCCGYPVSHVAEYIHKQGEYKTAKLNSLTQQLQLYRRDILPADILTTRRPHVIVSAREQYTDKLQELRRLDVQFEALLYRFDLEHARERELGVTNMCVDRIQHAIYDCIKLMHQIKMDLGISGQRHLGTLTVSAERLEEIRQKYGEGASRAMADPVSRARVLSVLRAVQDEAKNRSDSGDGIVVKRTHGRVPVKAPKKTD